MRVSEIRVKRIRVNQGLGVTCKTVEAKDLSLFFWGTVRVKLSQKNFVAPTSNYHNSKRFLILKVS